MIQQLVLWETKGAVSWWIQTDFHLISVPQTQTLPSVSASSQLKSEGRSKMTKHWREIQHEPTRVIRVFLSESISSSKALSLILSLTSLSLCWCVLLTEGSWVLMKDLCALRLREQKRESNYMICRCPFSGSKPPCFPALVHSLPFLVSKHFQKHLLSKWKKESNLFSGYKRELVLNYFKILWITHALFVFPELQQRQENHSAKCSLWEKKKVIRNSFTSCI